MYLVHHTKITNVYSVMKDTRKMNDSISQTLSLVGEDWKSGASYAFNEVTWHTNVSSKTKYVFIFLTRKTQSKSAY